MIRTIVGVIFAAGSFFQTDPASKWGMVIFALLLIIWDAMDTNGSKLDDILSNQKIINNNIKNDPNDGKKMKG